VSYLNYSDSAILLKSAFINNRILDYNSEKNIFRLIPEKKSEEEILFRPPLVFPDFDRNFSSFEELEKLSIKPNYLIILLRADSCSIGYFEKCEMTHHKVLSAYMTRKKQGKSQLTYLKTKGKSRAGSRVRLRSSFNFFDEIADKINEWQVSDFADKIFVYTPVALKQYLFSEDSELPFSRDDSRIRKIPFSVKTPSYDELVRINFLLSNGELF